MNKPAVESAAFFVVAPGTVAGLVPWPLSRWELGDPVPWWAPGPVRVLGGVLLAVAVVQLLHSFGRFVMEGVSTPSPFAPPRRLVVGGFYVWLAFASFVRWREGPVLTRRFGAEYETYRVTAERGVVG